MDNQTTNKARRAIVNYCGFDIECFQMPNGSYDFSQTQLGATLGKNHHALGRFLETESPEALSVKGLTTGQTIEIIDNPGTKIKLCGGIKVLIAYWTHHAKKGDTKAQAYLAAGTEETLTRLCDAAFGVEEKTLEETKQSLENNFQNYDAIFMMMEKISKQVEGFQSQLALKDSTIEKLEKHIDVLSNEIELYEEEENKLQKNVYAKYRGLEEAVEYFKNFEGEDGTFTMKDFLYDREFTMTQGQRSAAGRKMTGFLEICLDRKPEKYGTATLYRESQIPMLKIAIRSVLGL